MKLKIKGILFLILATLYVWASPCVTNEYDQVKFEKYLIASIPYCGGDDGDEEPYVPLRYTDGMRRHQWYMSQSGWSTNQIVSALMLAMTNYLSDADWADERKRRCSGMAACYLSDINLPVVTNMFRHFNDSDNTPRMKLATIPGMFRYTNLEPDVLDYMRTLCVRTNVYDVAADIVAIDMFKALETMPSDLKPAATNRVAQYMYFAIHHVTDCQGWQDRELAMFIPAYSNSVQRLDLMRYVSTSATNTWERANASNVVQRLQALPSNELNNVQWITE